MYEYICLRCGKKLYPTAQSDDNKSSVLYDLTHVLGLTAHRRFPAYFTHEEMRSIVGEGTQDGSQFTEAKLSFQMLMSAISKRLEESEIAEITFENVKRLIDMRNKASVQNNSEFIVEPELSVDDEKEHIEEPSDEEDIDYTKNQVFHIFMKHSKVVGDMAVDPIISFCNLLLSLFSDEYGNERIYTFQIKINLDKLGTPNTRVGYVYKDEKGNEVELKGTVICGERSCWRHNDNHIGAPVPEQAWKHEHVAIGFIGAPNSGKTCLITSVFSNMIRNGCDRIVSDKQELIDICVKRYNANTVLPKTEGEGSNCFNVTFYYKDKLVTLVDISGECFDFDNGTFDKVRANKNFHMIQICKCYVLCLDPQNELYRGMGLAPAAIGEFVEYLVLGNKGLQYAAPILLTVTKCDCNVNEAVIDYDKLNNKKTDELEANFTAFLHDSDKHVRKNYNIFYQNASKKAYIASALCSAYGCEPKPDEDGLVSLEQLKRMAGYNTLYLTEDGKFYITDDSMRNDYPVSNDYTRAKYYCQTYDRGIRYNYSESCPEGDWMSNELRSMKFIVTKESSEGIPEKGVIYNENDYNSVPNPINLDMINRWLMRVCGIDPLVLERENDDGEICGYEQHKIKSSDRWDINEFKAHTPEIASGAVRMFSNYTRDDLKISDHRKNKLTLAGMKLLDVIGISKWRNKKIDD